MASEVVNHVCCHSQVTVAIIQVSVTQTDWFCKHTYTHVLVTLCPSFCRFQLYVVPSPKQKFLIDTGLLQGWVHVVLVVHGLTDGKGFSVYINKSLIATAYYLRVTGTSEKDVSSNDFGSDVAVDELVIWLKELKTYQVVELYNFYMNHFWVKITESHIPPLSS